MAMTHVEFRCFLNNHKTSPETWAMPTTGLYTNDEQKMTAALEYLDVFDGIFTFLNSSDLYCYYLLGNQIYIVTSDLTYQNITNSFKWNTLVGIKVSPFDIHEISKSSIPEICSLIKQFFLPDATEEELRELTIAFIARTAAQYKEFTLEESPSWHEAVREQEIISLAALLEAWVAVLVTPSNL